MPERLTGPLSVPPPLDAPAGPAVDLGLHEACQRLGGEYLSTEDGGQACRVPPLGPPAAGGVPDLVVPLSPAIEVRASAVVED